MVAEGTLMKLIYNNIANIRESALYKSKRLGKTDQEKTVPINNVFNSIDRKYLNKVYYREKDNHEMFMFNKIDFHNRKILLRGEASFSELVYIIEKIGLQGNKIKIVDILPAEAAVRKWLLSKAWCELRCVHSKDDEHAINAEIDKMFTGTNKEDKLFDFIIEHFFRRAAPNCEPDCERFAFINRVDNYVILDEHK